MTYSLKDRIALITGANQGLGFEIAKKYVQAGASVMLCARNGELLGHAKESLLPLAMPGQQVLACTVDVAEKDDVGRVVSVTIERLGGCHVIVNNAGIYGPKGPIEEVDWDDWLKAIQINLFGSILMCRAILPHFKRQGYGKIVQLSGGGATNPLPLISAYAVSKAAIVRFVDTLAEEVRENNIDVNAIAPGPLNTRLLDEILEAGPTKVGKTFYERSLKQKQDGGAPLEKGAELAVFLGAAESDGISGKLISAVWDDWSQWPQHRPQLSSSDVYTLRRITGRDRGFDWGDK